MGLRAALLGLLSAAAVLLLQGGYAGSSSHSLCIFYTLFMGSSQDGAQYIVVVYVDDQLAARFDPTTRRMLPQVAWLHNVREKDVWDRMSWTVNNTESTFKNELHVLRIDHNSSGGFHSWQKVVRCNLTNGQKQGAYQYAYDGEDFISLDQKTLSWTAVNVHAQETKRRWEAEPLIAHSTNNYLENECIELLQTCIMYGKDSLLRKEPPVAKVTRRIPKTLICQVYGFYPKEVNVTWRKDGVQKNDTSSEGVLPNADGTYHTLLSIQIDPKEEKGHYHCYVEHAGLLEPLIVAWKEPANVGLVVGGTVAVVVPVVFIAFMIFCFATSQEFKMCPVLRDQDQRQQDQDQRQQDQDQRQQDQDQRQLRRMGDFQRTRLERGPLGPSWDSC